MLTFRAVWVWLIPQLNYNYPQKPLGGSRNLKGPGIAWSCQVWLFKAEFGWHIHHGSLHHSQWSRDQGYRADRWGRMIQRRAVSSGSSWSLFHLLCKLVTQIRQEWVKGNPNYLGLWFGRGRGWWERSSPVRLGEGDWEEKGMPMFELWLWLGTELASKTEPEGSDSAGLARMCRCFWWTARMKSLHIPGCTWLSAQMQAAHSLSGNPSSATYYVRGTGQAR